MTAFKERLVLRYHRLRMRRHYREVFLSDAGKIVLDDLARFCGANADLFRMDARQEAYKLGKRRVLLRIASWLRMTLEEIEALAKVASAEDQGEDEP